VRPLISTTQAKIATGHRAKAVVLSALNLVPEDIPWAGAAPAQSHGQEAHWQSVKHGKHDSLVILVKDGGRGSLAAGPPRRWAAAQQWRQETVGRSCTYLLFESWPWDIHSR